MHKCICAVCFCGLDPVWCRLYSCLLKVYSSMHNCNHVEFTYALYDLVENLALCVGPLTALLICLQIRENSSYSLSLFLSYSCLEY